jgi:hypothetical protein
MSEGTPDRSGPADGLPLRIAFYLPQFHPTPQNDAWHGLGFTEWTLVAQARPLFSGHDQPQLPGELGFYDLRLPETRELQARLARAHGITGFCYYHYWFKGQGMLARPFNEVLASGKPEFPFCLCWADESWFRRWQSNTDELLLEQEFDEEDDVAHIRWLIEAFKDDRYIHVKGRPLLSVYNPDNLPNPQRTVEIWRAECARAGVPEPWLVGFETWGTSTDPMSIGFDAGAEFIPHGIAGVVEPIEPRPPSDPANSLYDYATVARYFGAKADPSYIRYPCVATSWDNTPRRRDGEIFLLHGSSPERYGDWLAQALRTQKRSQGGDGVVFINAWNEWAEGAHLEPDAKHGRGYLEAARDIVRSLGGTVIDDIVDDADHDSLAPTSIEDLYAELYRTFMDVQARTSATLAAVDRRLQAMEEDHEKAMAALREQNRTLAQWSLSLEAQLVLLGGQRAEPGTAPT